MKKGLLIFGFALLWISGGFYLMAQEGAPNAPTTAAPSAGNAGGTIATLDQWKSDGTNITQRTSGKPLKLTGLESLSCLGTNSSGVVGAGTCGGGSSFSTTSADYWETQQTSRSADDLSNNTTTDLAEGSNLYYTSARGLSSFITNLAATTSVASITTLSNLTISASQISGILGVPSGGTGRGSFTAGNLLVGDGNNALGSVATTTASCSNGSTCTSFIVIGSSPITISSFGYPFPSNATSTALTLSAGASIPKLTNLTSNGFVKTSGGNGTLSIDTNTYLTAVTADSPLSGSGTSGSHLVIANAAADGSTKGAASFTANDFDATTGNISLDYTNGQKASASLAGFLTSTDWSTFNNKISSSSLSGTAPITYNSSSGAIGCNAASGSQPGCLASADWTIFNNKISSTSLSGASVISYTSGTGVITTTGGTFGTGDYVFPTKVTIPNASTTLLTASLASSTAWRGGGLETDCDTGATSKVLWDATTGRFSCGTDQTGAGGGITSLGPTGQAQTGSTQTFATTTDTNVGLTITSTGDTHTFTSTWAGTLADARVSDTLTIGSGSTVADGALSANVSLLGQTIGVAELASADFGDWTCNGSACTVDAGAISNADLANSTISGVALGSNLNALTNDATLNGSSYNGSSAISDWGLNLANANAWTALQSFVNASSSIFSAGRAYFGTTATTTIGTNGSVVLPSGASLTITGTSDGCATFASGVLGSTGTACGAGGGGGGDPFTHPAAGISATTSLMQLFGNASTTGLSANYAYFGSTATSSFNSAGVPSFPLTGLLQGTGAGGSVTAITNSSTVGQVLRVTGASTYAWGAVDLADTDAVTGALSITNAGLGAAFTDPNADQLMFWDDSAAKITGISTLTGAAISGTTLTINDVTCTDCLSSTEIGDEYLFNSGDVGTGNYDFGGATVFEIPNGTAPTINAVGQIAIDTTSGNLIMSTSTNATSIVIGGATTTLYAFTVASSSPDFVSGGSMKLPAHFLKQNAIAIICQVEGGTSQVINLSNEAGSSDTNAITCTTTSTQFALTSNKSWNAYTVPALEFGTKTGSPDYIHIRVIGNRTSD